MCSTLPFTSFCADSCVISAAPVKTLSSFIPSAPLNTWRWWLFCFWILVNIFHSAPSGWFPRHNLWRGAINNICPSLVSLHIKEGSRRGKRRVCAPFLKFTWTRVQTAWRGRTTLRAWVSRPTSRRSQDLAGKAFWEVVANKSRSCAKQRRFFFFGFFLVLLSSRLWYTIIAVNFTDSA